MKKQKWMAALCCACFLTACGSMPQIQEEQVMSTPAMSSSIAADASSTTVSINEEGTFHLNPPTPLALGERVSSETAEFVIQYINLARKATAPMRTGSSIKGIGDDEYVLELCIEYQNKTSAEKAIDELISGVLVCSDGSKKVNGSIAVEEHNRGGLSIVRDDMMPALDTAYIHYMFIFQDQWLFSHNLKEVDLTIDSKEYTVALQDQNGETIGISEDENVAPFGTYSMGGVSATEYILGETVTKEDLEFCVEHIDWAKEIYPYYEEKSDEYYPAEDGMLFFDICFMIHNRSDKTFEMGDLMNMKLWYQNSDQYSCFDVVENTERTSFDLAYDYLEPQGTAYMHWLFEMPEEIGGSSDPMWISFSLEDTIYTCKVR